jgi:alkanesulfonate monooxygenase SsuD/methylene tetrahydromethanopterin reductase-like flavin-dependent oxidoreductase (luciferase family)
MEFVVARRDLLFGISVTPSAVRHPELVAQVQAADRGALDLVGVQDHPYQSRFLDTFALVADLLARTTHLHVFPDVANLPLRGPVMIAKAAASLDVMSRGRFDLGLGVGTFWDAVEGMGGPRRSPSEAADALEEAILIIRSALEGDRVVRGPGPVYPIPGYPPGPPPVHKIELWLGTYRPRGLRLTGQLADGWLPSLAYMRPDGFRVASATIDEAAVRAGRDPATIRRIYNVNGSITTGYVGDDDLVGPVNLWVDTLTSWVEKIGVDSFVFWPAQPGITEVERFAEEVVPAVRRAAATEAPRTPGDAGPQPG